jgi:hypothetical protein
MREEGTLFCLVLNSTHQQCFSFKNSDKCLRWRRVCVPQPGAKNACRDTCTSCRRHTNKPELQYKVNSSPPGLPLLGPFVFFWVSGLDL